MGFYLTKESNSKWKENTKEYAHQPQDPQKNTGHDQQIAQKPDISPDLFYKGINRVKIHIHDGAPFYDAVSECKGKEEWERLYLFYNITWRNGAWDVTGDFPTGL